MEVENIVAAAESLKQHVASGKTGWSKLRGPHTQVVEFLRQYAGPRSAFAESARKVQGGPEFAAESLI